MRLIIVESPTKGRTISKFLGPGYRVLASYGHVRDLPKNELGIDIGNNFEPKYVIPTKAKKTVKLLKEEAKKANQVIVSTDPDREGEAIAWHIIQVIKPSKPYQRITFHEITKPAIEEALKNPREIDISLVNSQQARRILDRIVGYKLSPFLWRKVARGLSAGRVQSVTVRLVVEREREIQGFVPQEYWAIIALLSKTDGTGNQFEATLAKINDKTIPKLGIKNQKKANEIIDDLGGAEYQIENIEKKEAKKNPLPPFTTSTLQQEAWQRLRFPAKFTMQVAQSLYENGVITYHRTDSLNLSDQSLFMAKKVIGDNYGKNYWAGFFRRYKAKGRVQEAHEAIRPTYPDRIPSTLAGADERQSRLYDLIWKRFIACQMAPAVFNSTVLDIKAKKYIFRATGQTLSFDGFLKIYPMRFEENELPELQKNEELKLIKLTPSQHFTQPPARYTEATLIKALEEQGIGRPSTYAPILSTIQERNYVEKNEEKRFVPTDIGITVNDLLVKHFPAVVDVGFTAKMEENLDEIAAGKEDWVKIVGSFYQPFAETLLQKYKEVSKKDLTTASEKTCPTCGSPLVIRFGKFGRFYACSTFPKCKYTESLGENKLNIKCPKCKEGDIVGRRTKKKKIFYGCSRWPKCDFASWDKPTIKTCLECGAFLVETKRKQIKCSSPNCISNKLEGKSV